MGPEKLDVAINVEDDIVRVRGAGRDMCRDLGIGEINQVKVVTAISELARNIYYYAKPGNITLQRLGAPRPGIEVVATDQGPGIPDVKVVLSGGYQSKTGMGKGLVGARRLADFFEVETAPGKGTRVVLRKYCR
jgi:serine/threonine-protein kinase RsbT